jgi:hypothetical protein
MKSSRFVCIAVVCLVLAPSGCLYVGGVNDMPALEIEIDDPKQSYRRGDAIMAKAVVDDLDKDEMRYAWQLQLVAPEQAQPLYLHSDGTLSSAEDTVFSVFERLDVTAPAKDAPGSYQLNVRLTATDPSGATGVASARFSIENAAPTAKLAVTSAPLDGDYAREQSLFVTAASSEDEPGDLLCENGAKITYAVDKPDKSAFEVWRVIPCKPGETLDKLELRLKPSQRAQTVTLKATIEDRFGAASDETLSFNIAPSQSGCIMGSDPSFIGVGGSPPAKLLIVDKPLTLTATTTRPLAAQKLVYRWSRSSLASGPYSPLAGQGSSSFTVDPNDVLPGETWFYRVAAGRDEGDLDSISCSVEQAVCDESTAGAGDCFRWVSWEVVAR